MNLKKLVLGSSVIGYVAISSISTPSIAQRSPVVPKENKTQLLEQPCVSSNQYKLFRTKDLSITSEAQFFNALFKFELTDSQRSGTLSCKLNARKRFPKETLRLQYGLQDDYAAQVKIQTIIYLDGKPTDEDTLSSGDLRTKLFDISNIRSIGIKTVYKGPDKCCYESSLYIFDAEILPVPISQVSASKIQNINSIHSSSPYSILTNSAKKITPSFKDRNNPSVENQNSPTFSDLLNEVQGLRQQIHQLFK